MQALTAFMDVERYYGLPYVDDVSAVNSINESIRPSYSGTETCAGRIEFFTMMSQFELAHIR